MLVEIGVRYLHFASILALGAGLIGQCVLMRGAMLRSEIVRLQKLDIVYGLSAILVLVTGLLQWFAVGKPSSFYSGNPVFHAKITLFLVIGLVSIYPSVFFGKQRKGEPEDWVQVPGGVVWSVRAETVLLFLLPLLATLMARGMGLTV